MHVRDSKSFARTFGGDKRNGAECVEFVDAVDLIAKAEGVIAVSLILLLLSVACSFVEVSAIADPERAAEDEGVSAV